MLSRRDNWRGILLPAIVVFCSLLAATPGAGAQGEPLPEVVSADRIKLEEFEPAVRDQVGRTWESARKKPNDASAVGNLGMMFQVYGRYELAETCYIRAHGLEPRTLRWTYYLAVVETALGKNDRAIGHLKDALSIDAGYAAAGVRLAQLLLDSGDAAQSAATCRSIIERNKNLATAHFGLGQALAAQSDWTGAIDSYRRACELSENYAAAHYALGLAYRNAGDMARAREHLQLSQVLKQARQPAEDPLMDDVNGLYSGGLTRFAKGSTFFREGKAGEAIQEFEGALEVNPKLVMAHINLIALYGQLNQSEKAEQHFHAALALDPGWVESYYNWGLFLAQHGRKGEAAAMFQKAVGINPSYAEAQVQLGILLDERGERTEAAAHYRRALDVNPANRQAHYFLGRNLLAQGNAKEAVQQLLQTTSVEDAWTPLCMQAVAIAYESAGDRGQAVRYLREAKQRAVALHMNDLVSQLQRDVDRLLSEARRP